MSKGKKSKQPKIENSQFDALINQLMSAEGAQKMKLLDALKQSYLNDLVMIWLFNKESWILLML